MIKMKIRVISVVMACFLGLFLTQVDDAVAATRCYEKIVNGHVVKRTCNKVHQYRIVCRKYWRYGVLYRSCRKVYY